MDKERLVTEIECDLNSLLQLYEKKMTESIKKALHKAFDELDEHFKGQRGIPGQRRDLLFKVPLMTLFPKENEELIFQYMKPILEEVQKSIINCVNDFTQEAKNNLNSSELVNKLETECIEMLGGKGKYESLMLDINIDISKRRASVFHYAGCFQPDPFDSWSMCENWKKILGDDLGIKKWRSNPTTRGIFLYLKDKTEKINEGYVISFLKVLEEDMFWIKESYKYLLEELRKQTQTE